MWTYTSSLHFSLPNPFNYTLITLHFQSFIIILKCNSHTMNQLYSLPISTVSVATVQTRSPRTWVNLNSTSIIPFWTGKEENCNLHLICETKDEKLRKSQASFLERERNASINLYPSTWYIKPTQRNKLTSQKLTLKAPATRPEAWTNNT